ncbi:FAD-binding protein [Sulfurisphaera tokodaii]|uniref:Electron transfer flavoprotein n=2 Tax=Sulfurisphaera tokodaii TaxID=111955 RepID=Q96ZQ8_SULTO|nr:FAD-binding protein [Sulfurisphaera tokodaii]BAB66866.1 electron transfer flavoprotein [Sulfurisphaera tokodaii str. 7]HII75220.1 electron transfer flavoprotein subunit alpha [Sulfurisphaera tokodaii]
MRIFVSIKQVPDADDLRIDPVTNNLVREGVPAVINPPDLHAIEEGIRLRERYGGKVIVITMGPPQAENALREAIAMGADEAYLITDRAMAGADTWATSYTLYKAIKKIGEGDIYLFGRRAVDGETEQVGPQTGKWLGIPSVGYVSKFIEIGEGKARVIRTVENEEEEIEVPLPAVFTVLETINKPREPDILSLIKSKTVKIPKLSKDDIGAEPNKIGLAGSPTKVIKVHPPPKTRNPEIYRGNDAPQWVYDKIVKSLKEVNEVKETYVKPQPKAKVNGEIWVYIDHTGDEVNRVSWEIMSEGRRIADLLDTKLAGVIVGDDEVKPIIKEAFNYGVDKVYHARVKGFPFYINDVYTRALSKVIKKYKPEAIFFPGTRNSRELASTTAIEVDTGLIADCVSFDVDEKGIIYSTRPDFGGKEMSTIICPNHKPVMITVRGGVFYPIKIPKEGEVIVEEIEDLSTKFKVLNYTKLQKRNVLAEADIVIGVGRGIKSPENIKLAEELASVLNGVVGVSKPLADMGWYPKERQIGQTGTTIRPKLYIALGISGAVQHLVGISGARRIIAINIDPEAPIFQNCDYGVIGDIFEVVPGLVKIVRERGVPQ